MKTLTDTIDCDIDLDIFKTRLESWWKVTDRESTQEIVEWLVSEGHHADAHEAVELLHEKGVENIPDDAWEDEESKIGAVCLIVESMWENAYCTTENIPRTTIACDLVQVVNVGRWAYPCSYITENEMWKIMQQAVHVAEGHFSSWEAYGRSFVLGRGAWHGDPDDSETAYEIISLLPEQEESPWKQIAWNK